jgi:hypothetical protein
MKKTIMVLIIWFIAISSSCRKEEKVFPYGVPLSFDYYVTNSNGQRTSNVSVNENFKLCFSLENLSNEKWIFFQSKLTSNSEFFRLYKYNTLTDSIDLGKPYKPALCFGNMIIGAGEKVILEIPWDSDTTLFNARYCTKNSATPKLSKGKYRTAFSQIFQFNRLDSFYQTPKVAFNVELNLL